MYPIEWTQTTSDPPSPTLTAVDVYSPRFGLSDADLKQANAKDGVPQDPEPLDLEANRPADDLDQRDNEKIKRENQHLEVANPAVADTLRCNGVSLMDMGDDGKIYIRSNLDDLDNPRNWPKWRRYLVAGLASWLTIIVCSIASGYSTGTDALTAEFDLSEEVGTLGLSLYILGFAFGPMFAAPLSETYGRRVIYLITWFFFTLFQLPVALAPNYACILVFRFLGGLAGSVPLANTGGVVNDLFGVEENGYATAMFAFASVAGPPLGNVISGFLAEAAGWRWLFWFYLILLAVHYVIIFFGIPETRQAIIMTSKAKKLRRMGNGLEVVYAEQEREQKSPREMFKVSMTRPYVFLFTEPITYLAAAINGFALGMIFLSNTSFPLIFGPGNEGHHWHRSGAINATLGSYVVGAMIAVCLQPLQQAAYRKHCARAGKPVPEALWWSALWATPFMPMGLAIASGFSGPQFPWIAPLIGFACFGFGYFAILMAVFSYVMHSYGTFAASSLAGVVFVRNIVGAIFPLFARQMFLGLGNQWSLGLLAILCCALVPIPFFLFRYGKAVRMKSPYCATHDI
ncbi:hypothetical protein NliqN6_1037 [Naganishia liquefaciens]|uniref:Major facilitator superfamily (MFS) profile domain-containing protein n=1 Tax=Naganishia liquefaciens TaxID=104408 RepID=A0A8H3TP44_9TREE|nr:hypothetical protein NliqN6_1037 [Naganishia liquefaciens]